MFFACCLARPCKSLQIVSKDLPRAACEVSFAGSGALLGALGPSLGHSWGPLGLESSRKNLRMLRKSFKLRKTSHLRLNLAALGHTLGALGLNLGRLENIF